MGLLTAWRRRDDVEHLAQLVNQLADIASRPDADLHAAADTLNRCADHIDATTLAGRLNPEHQPQQLRDQAARLRAAAGEQQ